jgi:predicted aspartyl protease
MELMEMGKVIVTARIENLNDLYVVEQGILPQHEVRRVEVPDAMVDTGATFLSMPKHLIEKLGLQRYRTRRARTSGGVVEFNMYGMVLLTVQGRVCRVEVAELPDDCPVLIGQIPLEALDFIVDPVNQRLLGNPDHGGEHMMDLF